LFVPIENKFVLSVDFQVFNRWGNKVFETSDPELNWNGNGFAAEALKEGTYYFTCKVFEQRLDGLSSQSNYLHGYIQLIR
jgi:gliding motility-associated-like protein